MTDTLFDLPECKSPRLLWMEKHGIRTYYNKEMKLPWIAIRTDNCGIESSRAADTEHNALAEIAVAYNLKLWNQP